jgi:hypothetical protein
LQRTCALVLIAIAVLGLLSVDASRHPAASRVHADTSLIRRDIQPFDRTAQVMASVDVWIVWTDHPCIWTAQQAGGCFDAREPNVISIVPGMGRIYTRYAILHEAAHKLQLLNGTYDTDPNVECDADAQAVAWGALFSGYDCPGLPSRESFGE